MYSAQDIANWFIRRAYFDSKEGDKGSDCMTHLKLQKLLYFAQGCYLAIEDKPLFDEKIYAWAHGPVVKDLYYVYKSYGNNVIENYENVEIDPETESILNEVYNVFGEYSAWGLSNMTHEHKPWKDAKENEEIMQSSIKDYFKENILEN